ncbi:hypothetical protein [Chryseobacterium sp. WX]|uniref:hypothetical protein n=1 Tax=Chryseobacterium sp. WX TaxID=3031803 RepID=UPI00240A7157|nr:hypothetical protein [Chryseobacterium sp. WX]WFB69111.1 hypothetical protein PZ898_06740 [Chryseobacterium sp. WX]
MKTKLLTLALITVRFFSVSAQQHLPEDNLLFNAFKQSNVNGGGNCASIALIKASIGTFGLGKVFTSERDNLNMVLKVKLKNSTQCNIKYSEIDQSIKENGFKLNSTSEAAIAIKSYADTCFAVMVKVNELISKQKFKSYEESLSSMLDGYYTPNIYSLLGLKFKQIPSNELVNYNNVIFYNSYHAVYSSYGYYDETKSTSGYSPNSSFSINRFGYKCSWYLCKPRKAFVIE